MDGVGPSWTTRKLMDVLVGIELGIIGGVVMLVWFAASSSLIGQYWWTVPNLFASKLASSRSVRLGPGWATLAGVSLHLVLSGMVGAIAGFITTGGRIAGIAIAIAWYAMCYLFLWKRMAPLVLVYGYQPALAFGFLLFGSALGWHRAMLGFVLDRTPNLPWEKHDEPREQPPSGL